MEKAIKMKKGKKVGIIRRVGEAVDVVKDVVMVITRWITATGIVIEIETTETVMEAHIEADGTTIINEVEAVVIGVAVLKERQLSTIVMMMAAIIEVGGVEIVAEAVIAVNAVAVEEVVVVVTEMTINEKNSTKTAHTPPKTLSKKLIMIMNQSVKKVETKAMTISNNNSISNEEEVAAGTVADAVVDVAVDREVEVDSVEVVGEEAVKVADEVEATEIHIISVTLPIRSMLIETY